VKGPHRERIRIEARDHAKGGAANADDGGIATRKLTHFKRSR
jgi:hypothetical protein